MPDRTNQLNLIIKKTEERTRSLKLCFENQYYKLFNTTHTIQPFRTELIVIKSVYSIIAYLHTIVYCFIYTINILTRKTLIARIPVYMYICAGIYMYTCERFFSPNAFNFIFFVIYISCIGIYTMTIRATHFSKV